MNSQNNKDLKSPERNEQNQSNQQQESKYTLIEKRYKDKRNQCNQLQVTLDQERREKQQLKQENKELKDRIRQLLHQLDHEQQQKQSEFYTDLNEYQMLNTITERNETVFSDEQTKSVIVINQQKKPQTQRKVKENLRSQTRQQNQLQPNDIVNKRRLKSPDTAKLASVQEQKLKFQSQEDSSRNTFITNGSQDDRSTFISANKLGSQQSNSSKSPQRMNKNESKQNVNDNEAALDFQDLKNILEFKSQYNSSNKKVKVQLSISTFSQVQVDNKDVKIHSQQNDTLYQISQEILNKIKPSPTTNYSSQNYKSEDVRDSDTFFAKKVQKSKYKNINDLSSSIVCSSLSSRVSTESYLKQKNLNIGQHKNLILQRQNQDQNSKPKDKMQSFLKQSSLRSQTSLKRKQVSNHGFAGQSINSMVSVDIDERKSGMKHIPTMDINKTLKDYLKQRIFQEFLIIGHSQQKGESDLFQMTNNKLMAETQFMFPCENKNCERRNVIKDFCFPCGISVTKQPSVEEIKRQLRNDKKTNKSSSFVFSLSGTQGDDNQQYSEIFCLSTTFHDFIVNEKTNEIFLTDKAFCFMFDNTFFKLQYDFIILLKNMYIENRLKLLNSACTESPSKEQRITNLANQNQKFTAFDDVMRQALMKYYNMQNLEQTTITFSPLPDITFKQEVEMNMNPNKVLLRYFNGKLFKCISFEIFYMIFMALLLERSIIFVSKSKNRLSSILFTMKSMLLPFKWWHVFITIVPMSLLDVLEAPVPVLLGITKDQFVTFDYTDIKNRMWVLVDDDSFEIETSDLEEGEDYLYQPHLGGLRDKLEPLSREIRSIADSDVQECEEKCMKLQKIIETSFSECIIEKSEIIKQLKNTAKEEINLLELEKEILSKADERDYQFLERFLKTQMFVSYVEDLLNH